MKHTDSEHAEYAREAGLLEQDMPPMDHPLFQNDAPVNTLADLIEARTEQPPLDSDASENTGTRTRKDTDDADYLSREDFVEEMGMADPDPDADVEDSDFITGAEHDRSVDITGTATGIARGMATHLPLDLGADGFQIEEAESSGDPRLGVGGSDFGMDGVFQDKDGNLVQPEIAREALANLREVSGYTAQSEEKIGGFEEPSDDSNAAIETRYTDTDNTENANKESGLSADDALDGTRKMH